jgi:phage-related protein
MEALTAKQEVYNKRADEQRKKIEVMTDALENAKKEFGENSDQVKNWQIKLNNAEADLAKTEKSIKQTADQIDNFGKEANDGGDAIEKAGKQAKESGDNAEKGKSGWAKLGDGLKGIGKLAGEAVLALGAAAAGAATGAVAMTISAANTADEINTLAAQTGLSTEEIQKFQYATEVIDVPLETLTGSMAKLTKNMATAKKGTGDASAAFKALGISVTDSNGELRNNQDVFNEAIDALGKMENETQRDAYAMQIFGKSAQDLNPLILGGADALKELGDQAEAAGLILSQDALDNLNKVTDATDIFKSTLKGTGTLFATAFAGPIATGTNILTEKLTSLATAFKDGGIGGLSEQIGTVIADIVNVIFEWMPDFIGMGTEIIKGLGKGLMDNIPYLVSNIFAIAESLLNTLIGMLPEVVKAGFQVVSQLALGIADAIPELIPTLVDTVMMIVGTLIDNVDMLVDAALNIILALADGLIAALPVLIEKIPQIIDGLLTAITENMPKILEAGVKIVVMLAGGIIKAIPSLVKSIPQLIAAVLNALGSLITSVASVGVNMVSGLWKGISGSLTWIKDKIKGWVGNVLAFVKKLFGIASPSKVFAEMGGFLSAGLAEGITDKSGLVDRAMSKLGGKLTADANVSVTAASQTRSASGYVVTNLYMDGAIVASKTSSAQFKKNAGRARSYGVVPG